MFVWMGNNPWGEGAKDILPVPSSADRLDENKVIKQEHDLKTIRMLTFTTAVCLSFPPSLSLSIPPFFPPQSPFAT